MVLLPWNTSDLRMTRSLPTVSLPSPSTETISGAYIVRMTSKCFPWLHSSINFPATVSTLMANSFLGGLFLARVIPLSGGPGQRREPEVSGADSGRVGRAKRCGRITKLSPGITQRLRGITKPVVGITKRSLGITETTLRAGTAARVRYAVVRIRYAEGERRYAAAPV